MADLFGVKVPAISKHLKNIFAAGELSEGAVISILETSASDGKSTISAIQQISPDFDYCSLLVLIKIFLIKVNLD